MDRQVGGWCLSLAKLATKLPTQTLLGGKWTLLKPGKKLQHSINENDGQLLYKTWDSIGLTLLSNAVQEAVALNIPSKFLWFLLNVVVQQKWMSNKRTGWWKKMHIYWVISGPEIYLVNLTFTKIFYIIFNALRMAIFVSLAHRVCRMPGFFLKKDGFLFFCWGTLPSKKKKVIFPINWFLVFWVLEPRVFLLVVCCFCFFFNLFLIDKNIKFPNFGKTILLLTFLAFCWNSSSDAFAANPLPKLDRVQTTALVILLYHWIHRTDLLYIFWVFKQALH